MAIDTRKAERRPLRFDTLDDLDRELDRIEASHNAGTLTHTGNYTPSQAMHHLARWIVRYETGDLPKRVPLPVKAFGRVFKGRFLNKGFPAGLPGPEGKTQSEPDNPFEESIAFLREKNQVLRTKDLGHRNPMFGRLGHEQAVKIHLRHCELHLSFLNPDAGP
ncbi:MAG: DUF1569 domain-containing protein [Phycisphaerales bacterium]